MSNGNHSTYFEKLKDPRWQKKKAEILARDSYVCRSCGRNDITLHAHHILYIYDAEPWDYPDDVLITYCEVCHNTEHLIGTVVREELLLAIENNPLLIHMVAQLCILTRELPEFERNMRSFLDKQMSVYYSKKKEKGIKSS